MAYIKRIEFFNTFILKGNTATDDDSGTANFHVEESRIKGGFNNPTVDVGVRAFTTADFSGTDVRENSLIYSGVFNSRTGVNEINQFSIAEDIITSLDANHGGIYKLFADFGSASDDLFIFQEEKVSGALIDKDAIYTAEGGRLSTAGANVIGQIQTYAGNYGIGKNPESFATYAGRKYFVDKAKGAVLRLSRDGITEISNYGMRSYFRDTLKNYNKIVGCWDIHNSQYVVSMQLGNQYQTLGFKEGVNGWVSFYNYNPESSGYLDAVYYTFKDGNIWEHYSNDLYSNFYGQGYNSKINLIFNQNPSANKNFLTINYEGSDSWNITTLETDTDQALPINKYVNTIVEDENLFYLSVFDKNDGKYVSNIINSSNPKEHEIVFGESMTGVKGFFLKAEVSIDTSDYKELFSMSTNYNINSY